MPRAHLLELVVRPCRVRHCPLQADIAVDLVKVLPELWEAHGCVSGTWGCRRFVLVRAPCLPRTPLSPSAGSATIRGMIFVCAGKDTREEKSSRPQEAGRFGGEKVVFVAAGAAHTVTVTAGRRL